MNAKVRLGALVPDAWDEVLLVEDNSARAKRHRPIGIASATGNARITVRLHRITASSLTVLAEKTYRVGAFRGGDRHGGRSRVALELLDRVPRGRMDTVVVAGTVFGCDARFLEGLAVRGLDYVVEVRPSARMRTLESNGKGDRTAARNLLHAPKWKNFELPAPYAAASLPYRAASLSELRLPGELSGRLFAAQTGGIPGVHRGTVFGLTSDPRIKLLDLLRVVGWARWIRTATRREERRSFTSGMTGRRLKGSTHKVNGTTLSVRSNITLSCRQDRLSTASQSDLPSRAPSLRGLLTSSSPILNVAELFAGAGGMALGFLLARKGRRRYRLVFSGEVNPIYVETLRRNLDSFAHQRGFTRANHIPESLEPVDLRTADARRHVRRIAREMGRVDVLIGGPPCQGFSNANRNSWHSANPNNRLVDVFLEYVEALRPPVFLLENVQGILWTNKAGRSTRATVVEHFARRMAAAGYEVFPKLLDAVWYGVPQYRSRFFLLGLRRELGYRREDLGNWGPFPLPTHGPGTAHPYVTVRQAIGDLPRVKNGENAPEMKYDEPAEKMLRPNHFLRFMRGGAGHGSISDHVTSRHADYVIERYRNIPQGGNWQDITSSLTNYANVERTHSNIYRRLSWDDPSITIGHYRKSMLVHPTQHRGLSLREASRLQSFPDWFRFSGGGMSKSDGLVHKQQQLANAVCPLVAKALADFLLDL